MTHIQLGGIPPVVWPSWQPWHVAVALGVLGLVAYWLARVQLSQAWEDFANAFFYSPSQKAKQRQRREHWQRVCRTLLAVTLLCFVAALALYLRPPG